MFRSALCAWLLLFVSPAWAEGEAGRAASCVLLGKVRSELNPNGEPGVVIVATSPSTVSAQTVVTNAKGDYRIPQLPPGAYSLRLEKEGFAVAERTGVDLRAGRVVRVDIALTPIPATSPRAEAPTEDVGAVRGQGVDVDQDLINRIAVVRVPRSGSHGQSDGMLAEDWLSGLSPSDPGYGINGKGPLLPPPAWNPDRRFEGLIGVNTATDSDGPQGSNSSRDAAPDWAVPLMPVVIPDGTPQTVFRAPRPSEPAASHSEPVSAPPPLSDMYFKGYGVNPTVDTEEQRFSTFSVDTDTASYSLTRAYLERSALPDERAVRVEEFVNAFEYGYVNGGDVPFTVSVEGFPSPARFGYRVLRIGVKAPEVRAAERKPSHLVFVIDVSGSMDGSERLGLVKRALHLLVDALDARDRISIVAYGSEAREVLAPTAATEKQPLHAAINSVSIGGSTNAQAGLELGYALAARNRVEGGINRIILCSDGVANNGVTDADGIWARVKDQAAQGITLSTVGFGMGHYNDVLMERLAQVGEGNYAYVDRLEEARRIFVQNLTGMLQVVAKDVKFQVEFDRSVVSRYRLIGYENRALTRQEFTDDKVDAGEVGAGHEVTALYEVQLRTPSLPLGKFRIRFKAPDGGSSKPLEVQLPAEAMRSSYESAAPVTRLAYVAAAFAEKLRGSYWIRPLTYDRLIVLWEGLGPALKDRPDVKTLGALIRTTRSLDKRDDRFESIVPVRGMDFDRAPRIK
ncbi:von Willebrand factor type A domain-containing protein [Corallococcus sp. M34]|uniref:YfbK domain-containing protein n=1 Tax=Citreicoccus inhibens TaxID=2849499 RepID=UPI001C22E965|nr:von Willebrand factor type A domain-containing protein [Citreicoccus inhibens]MBU8895489.1 von Willebrand factor type A domain-containing protein [Citreicoccus inhibens]